MLPDIKTVDLFHIGSIHISPFGVLVATGILVGRALSLYRAKQAGIPREEMDDAILYTLLSAFFFAHFVEAVFYHPEYISRQGLLQKESSLPSALCRVHSSRLSLGVGFWKTWMHYHI